MAVLFGINCEVYMINDWLPAANCSYTVHPLQDVQNPGQWEFNLSIETDEVRERYIGKSVASHWKHGAANPITYVNC